MDFGSGIAGIFKQALEDPRLQRYAALQIKLLMLHHETLVELERLGLSASVLVEGFLGPTYRHWVAESGANKATQERSFGVVFFGQELLRAEQALATGDFETVSETLVTFVAPPFRIKANPGGKKAKIPPALAKIVQASADEVWRKNPRLSASRVAEIIQPGWAEAFQARRMDDPPTVRTLRAKIRKPEWAKDLPPPEPKS